MTKYKAHIISFILLLILCGAGNSLFAQKSKKDALIEERKKIAAEKDFIEGQKYFMLDDYTKALGYFLHSLENDPHNPAIHYKIGEIYLKNEEIAKAEEYALNAMKYGSDNKYYFLLLGQVYNQQSRYSEAANLYEEMITKVPSAKEYLFDLASLYIYANDLDNAIATYNRAESAFGKLPEITYAKQKVYLKQNKLPKAIEEGKILVDSYPGEGTYLVNLAQILISNNMYEDAIQYLEGVDPDDSSYPNSRLLLSDIYRKTGNEEKSKENLKIVFANPELNINNKIQLMAGFISQLPNPEVEAYTSQLAEKLVSTHPDNANSYVIYGDFLLKTDKKTEALDKYMSALEFDNSNFNVWLNVMQIEWELNQLDKLLVHSEEAMEIFPNQPVIYFYNGTTKVIKKQYEDAVDVLEYGKNLARNDESISGAINGQLGEAYSALKEYEKSDEAFDKALEVDPNNYIILNNYSYYLAIRKDKLDLAKKMSQRLVKENPEEATFLDTHAWVLYMLKEYKDARKYLEKAIRTGGSSGVIIEHYGDVLFRLGEKDKAIEQWEKAKEMDGNSEFIDKKIADRKLYE